MKNGVKTIKISFIKIICLLLIQSFAVSSPARVETADCRRGIPAGTLSPKIVISLEPFQKTYSACFSLHSDLQTTAAASALFVNLDKTAIDAVIESASVIEKISLLGKIDTQIIESGGFPSAGAKERYAFFRILQDKTVITAFSSELRCLSEKSRKYLFMGASNKNTSEVQYLKSTDPMGFFNLIMPRKEGIEYYPDHRGDTFYIMTNIDKSFNFKVVSVKESFPFRDKWEDYIPHRTDVYLDDIELFSDKIIVSEISNGKRTIRVLDYESLQGPELKFTDNCYTVFGGSNPMFDSKNYRYVYESMTTPYSIIEYNMETGERKYLKQERVLGDFDPVQYKSELVFAPSSDGLTIPISLVYRRDKFKQDGTNPFLLEGYGAYGDFNDPEFSISRISLLDRGFIVGIAHVRGGIEKGKKWHFDGMLLKKKNTFSDFIDCAKHLFEKQYTSKDRLIITGASAGGLLVGATLNERPDLFKAAVLEVPFLDVVNTMLDSTLSATVSEYDEWGNPNEKEYFDYVRSYCPYQNIKAQDYPEILVTAGFNDPRVNYWEPLKWVAKLRENKTDKNQVIIKTSMSGHGGSSGRYDYYRETAMKYAYILHQAGIKE